MIRILLALAAVVVAAAAGLLGFNLYVQHRVAAAIEAPFDQLRAAGGKASHGKVTVDLLTRTVTVVDIIAESAAQPPARLRIASLIATGVRQPDQAHVSADSVELSDIEFATEATEKMPVKFSYKAPRLTVKDFSGPSTPAQLPAMESLIDIYRFGHYQLIAIAASSVTIPSMTGTINGGAATPGGAEFAYSGITVQDIRDGKVAATKADGLSFTMSTPQAGKREKLSGTLSNFVAYDFDAAAAGTIFDPRKSDDDSYHRIYRQVAAGPYVVTNDQGMRAQIDSITAEDIAVRPSKLQMATILALPQPGAAPPTQAQLHQIAETIADFYEGLRIGSMEMRGLAADTPQGPAKLSALRYNLENGQGDLAAEGLEAGSPQGPVKLERFVLKSLNLAHLTRLSAQFSDPAQRLPEQALGLFHTLEGVEIKGFAAPYKGTKRLLSIETFSLGWGQLVGSIPSKAHLVAKMVSPIDGTDPRLRPLLAAGVDKMALDLDLGAAWTEGSGAFVFAPANLEIGNLLKASARLALANVPRGLFSPDPVQMAKMAAQIEAGPIDLTVHDNGAIDVLVAQLARDQNVSRETARRGLIDDIKALGENIGAANPDAAAATEALARFVESPGQTLIIKLAPRAKVPGLQLIQLLKTDPLDALAQFRVEASTGL